MYDVSTGQVACDLSLGVPAVGEYMAAVNFTLLLPWGSSLSR